MKSTMKLPPIPKAYPNDTNLLSFMFTIARNDRLLLMFLTEIQFIRDHPNITEEQVRRELPRDTPRTSQEAA